MLTGLDWPLGRTGRAERPCVTTIATPDMLLRWHRQICAPYRNVYTAEVNPASRVQKFLFKGIRPQAITVLR
jgi:hypothetical protein